MKVKRARARERLPSYRIARVSAGARTASIPLGIMLSSRTLSPFLGSGSASGGAPSFPPASAEIGREALRLLGDHDGRNAFDQRLPFERTCVYPCLVCSWCLRDFHRGAAALLECFRKRESLALVGKPGFRVVSRHPRTLRRVVRGHAVPLPSTSRSDDEAWAFSSHGILHDRASDTSVASSAFPKNEVAFARLSRLPDPGIRVFLVRKPPRSLVPPPS